MSSAGPSEAARRPDRGWQWRTWAGLILSVLIVAALVRGLDWGAVRATLAAADGRWLALAVAMTLASIGVRVIRWAVLLDDRRVQSAPLASALLIGQAANYIVPFRVGDLVRAFLLGRNTPVGAAQALGSIAVEKTWDLLMLLLIVMAVVPTMTLPAWFAASTWTLALGFGAGLAVILMVLAKRKALAAWIGTRLGRPLGGRQLSRLAEFGRTRLDQLLDGMESLRRPRLLVPAAAYSVLLWGFAAGVNWAVMRALGLNSVPAALWLLAVLMLGNSVPSAPGGIGVVEGLAVVALGLCGVTYDTAFAVGVTLHAITLVPPLLLSAGALWWEGRQGNDIRTVWAGRTQGEWR